MKIFAVELIESDISFRRVTALLFTFDSKYYGRRAKIFQWLSYILHCRNPFFWHSLSLKICGKFAGWQVSATHRAKMKVSVRAGIAVRLQSPFPEFFREETSPGGRQKRHFFISVFVFFGSRRIEEVDVHACKRLNGGVLLRFDSNLSKVFFLQ